MCGRDIACVPLLTCMQASLADVDRTAIMRQGKNRETRAAGLLVMGGARPGFNPDPQAGSRE